MRGNIDYVFVLKDNIIANRERLHRNFFGMIPNFEMFQQIMNQCTENYECLVLDNTSVSNEIEDCVFWYKAKPRDNFLVGDARYKMANAYKKPEVMNKSVSVQKVGHGRRKHHH